MIKIYVKNIANWKSSDVYEASLEKLSPKRLAKVTACAAMEDRVRRLGASLVLQSAVEEWTGKSEPSLRYAYEENGKPFLPDYPQIHMNLSHAGEYVACAIADSPVGVDIQDNRGVREKILAKYYCKDEREYVNEGTNEERAERFYRIWCRKEAYIKYTGRGLAQDISSFSVLKEPEGVRFCERQFDGYAIAVCYAGDSEIIWNMEEPFLK